MSIKQLSESTPITIALTIMFILAAFWFGCELGAVRTKVEATQATQQQLVDVVSQLTAIAGENKLRISQIERTLNNP